MFQLLMLSLLVTLCLERNPVHGTVPVIGSEVATSQTAIAVYMAGDFRSLVER